MGTHMCKIRKEKMMEYALIIFGAIALMVLVIYIANKQKLSKFHIKLNIFQGFELDCRFRK